MVGRFLTWTRHWVYLVDPNLVDLHVDWVYLGLGGIGEYMYFFGCLTWWAFIYSKLLVNC